MWRQITGFAADNASTVGVVAILLSVVAILFSVVAVSRVRAVLRPLKTVRSHAKNSDSVVSAMVKAIESNQLKIEGLARSLEDIADASRVSFQYVGLVRYDAFNNIGGQQSYSLCLLDGNKDGVLISNLTGRDSTRSYAVSIKGGVPSRKLGDEEARAMDAALTRTTAEEAN
ncbi:MAG: DUF4446 family protein [Candidatus Latescibacterota bacterium]|nr:MAG: DUF4446 family protein [Candidatus Latescibacterota bacterium]